MDRPALQRWLDGYVAAWRSNDAGAIGDLFTADAEYRYHPADEPVFGRDAIVASWLEEPDETGTWDAWYEPFAVEGDRGVATGVSTYFDADGKPDRVLRKCVEQMPPLEQKQGTPGHIAACWVTK